MITKPVMTTYTNHNH